MKKMLSCLTMLLACAAFSCHAADDAPAFIESFMKVYTNMEMVESKAIDLGVVPGLHKAVVTTWRLMHCEKTLVPCSGEYSFKVVETPLSHKPKAQFAVSWPVMDLGDERRAMGTQYAYIDRDGNNI